MSSIATIGTFEGRPVEEVTLASKAGATAKIMTWGAVVRDMHVPHRGGLQRVVLGFETFEPYPQHSPYFGAIAGRFANRIGRGSFRLDGRKIQVDLNQNDPPVPAACRSIICTGAGVASASSSGRSSGSPRTASRSASSRRTATRAIPGP